MTYAINEATGLDKDLLILYCNRPNCKNIKPKFLHKELFIKIASMKYSKSD